jgi:hypothetical protein
MKDDMFQKISDFIKEQPLNEMFSFFDKIQSMLPSHKIKMAATTYQQIKTFH